MTDIIKTERHQLLAFYGRVSTSLQEDQKTIENQLMAMRDFADKNFGKGNYTVVREYLDEGWSGDDLTRPNLDQLRMDATEKKWDTVLIYDPDRLARRGAWQEVVMEELKELGIDVLFVTIPKPKTDEDVIMYKMRAVFTEYEKMKIKERFRIGKLRKVREGHILTSEALYGYTYIRNNKEKKEHGYYIINDEEARVVRMIFSWVGNEGLTLRQVVRRLQELAIKPRKSKKGVWATSTLTTMLRHKAYIGEAHWGSSYAVVPENPRNKGKYRKVKKSSRRNKPEEEWIASKIPVPVIVEEMELFIKVQAQLKTNFALCQRNTKNEYLLGSKIICSCGSKRCGEGPQHGKHLYYRCSNRVNSFPLAPTCNERGINARIADRLVWQNIVGLMTSPDLLQAQINRWVDTQKDKIQSSVGDIEAVEKEINKLKTQEDRYIKAYGAELFSLEQLREHTLPIKNRLTVLESQIKKYRQEKSQIGTASMPTENEIKTFAEAALQTLNNLSFEMKRAIVRNTIEKIIGTQQLLQVSGNIPLTLNHVAYKTIYRYRRSAQCG